MKFTPAYCIVLLTAVIILYTVACSKSSPSGGASGDPCAGKNITVNNTVTASSACGSTGSIVVNAAGSTGFTYKLNSSGTYQSSNTFNNIGAAIYTVFVKDASGCEQSASATVGSSGTASFAVNVSTAPANNCGGSNGSVTVNATGSSGFNYKLNNGAYQTANTFSNLPAGSNTVTVKDVNGCEVTAAANITVNTTPGNKFAAAKSVILANCSGSSCHTNGGNSGGRNFDLDCSIVAANSRIFQRAVVEGSMPAIAPLSVANKAIITDWINTGGGFNN